MLPIQPLSLTNVLSTGAASAGGAAAPSQATSFEGVLGQALQSLSSAQHATDQSAIGLATGKNVNLVDSMLSIQQTSLDFKLAMQVRDQVISAYQNIMQTQV
jgi:flagellar hook-basal body complex protein FliE